MGLTPLPLDPDLKAMLPDQLNLGPGKIGGMSPLPLAPPPVDVSGMSAGAAPATPMLKPLSVVNGSPRAMEEQAYQGDIQRLMPHPQQPGFFHKLGHILAQVGNVAGDIAAPGTMALIPGTGLNNQIRLGSDQRALAGLQGQDTAEQQADQQNTDKNRQLDIEQQRADQENPKAVLPWQEVKDYIGPNGEPVERNSQTGEFRVSTLPYGIKRVEPNAKPTPESVHPVIGDDGKPTEATFSDGKWLDAQGRPILNPRPIPPQPSFAAIYPQITAGRSTDEATTHWQQLAGQYQGALGNLENARNGSELAAAIAPVASALIEPTAAGTHRVNMAEINQAGPGLGSLARKVDAALEKAGNGALPPETLGEMRELVQMYQGLKYKQYLAQVKRSYDQYGTPANQRFVTSMDGQTELSLDDAMNQPHGNAGGGEQWQATATGKDGHQIGYRGGKWYDTQSGKAIQ